MVTNIMSTTRVGPSGYTPASIYSYAHAILSRVELILIPRIL